MRKRSAGSGFSRTRTAASFAAFAAVAAIAIRAQPAGAPDWKALEPEILQHFQALVKINTADSPAGERPAAEYLKRVLDENGIPAQMFSRTRIDRTSLRD